MNYTNIYYYVKYHNGPVLIPLREIFLLRGLVLALPYILFIMIFNILSCHLHCILQSINIIIIIVDKSQLITSAPSGRMPILDAQAKIDALEYIHKRCNEGYGFACVGSFADAMKPFTRDTMRRRGIPDSVPIPFSEKAYEKLYRELCTMKVRKGDRQDRNRFLRKIELLIC